MSKRIFITGASRGFGKIWAEVFLKRGDKVGCNSPRFKSPRTHHTDQNIFKFANDRLRINIARMGYLELDVGAALKYF